MSEHKANPFARGGPILPAIVRDIYGRILKEGDQLHVQTVLEQPYLIHSIAPVVDPTAPPNLMEIVLISQIRFRAMRNVPNNEFVRVLQAEERVPRPEEPSAREPELPALSIVHPDREPA